MALVHGSEKLITFNPQQCIYQKINPSVHFAVKIGSFQLVVKAI